MIAIAMHGVGSVPLFVLALSMVPVAVIGTTAAILLAASAAANAGGQVYANKKQASSAKNAAALESAGIDKELAFREAAEKTRHDEWLQTEQARKDIEKQNRDDYLRSEAERRSAWEAQEARAAPRRQAHEGALRALATRLGKPMPEFSQAAQSMPNSWGLAPGQSPSATQGGYTFTPPTAATRAPMRTLVDRSAPPRSPYGNPYPEGGTTLIPPVMMPQQTVWSERNPYENRGPIPIGNVQMNSLAARSR